MNWYGKLRLFHFHNFPNRIEKKENPEKETHNPLPIIPFHNIPPFLHNVITDRDSEKPDE